MNSYIHLLLYTAVAALLLTWGGNLFCKAVFKYTGLANVTPPDPIQPVKAGRAVGSLERLVIAIGLAAGSWEVIAAVIALKTVARFKELDEKELPNTF